MLKFDQLMSKKNPSIATTEELSALDESDRLNLRDQGLRLAFSAETFQRETLNDARYIKYLVMLFGYRDSEIYEQAIQFHECTQQDLDKFAPPSRDAEVVLNDIMSSETQTLYCLDWEKEGDDITIWGADTGYEYQRLEITFAPCNFVPYGFEEEYPIPEGCIEDEAAQREYLNSFDMQIYLSDERFVQDGYGNESITASSKFYSKQVSTGQNVWIPGIFKRNILEDESAMLQYGQQDEKSFHTFTLDSPQPSSWTNFPTKEEPENYFKYASFDIDLCQDIIKWNRQTYSVLDFLGDIGGLFEALQYMGTAVVAPFSSFALKVSLMVGLFTPMKAKAEGGQST